MMRVILGIVAMLAVLGSNSFAGSVSARISGGSLFVYGDRGDNGLIINSTTPGQIKVTGVPGLSGEPTIVNGTTNGTATLYGWNGGIYVFTYDGNDTVFIVNGIVNGATLIDLGAGNDTLSLGPSMATTLVLTALHLLPVSPHLAATQLPLELRSTLTVIGLGGKDNVTIADTSVHGYSVIDLGESDDTLVINDAEGLEAHFGDTLAVYPGNGQDMMAMKNFTTGRDLIVDDSLLPMNLSVTSAVVGQNVFIYGTSAADKVTLTNVVAHSLLEVFTEDGKDLLTLQGVDANQIFLFPGLADDTVKVANTRATRLTAYLDPGADSIEVTAGNYSYINLFGSTGNDRFTVTTTTAKEAYVYGEGDTDTLIRAGNSIPIFRVYTVENQ